jgi:hypothetical protein
VALVVEEEVLDTGFAVEEMLLAADFVVEAAIEDAVRLEEGLMLVPPST